MNPKFVAATIWAAAGAWGRKLISFFVFAILARHLQPESLGLVALALVYIAFVELLSKQGIGLTIVQTKEINQTKLNTAFYLNLVAAVLFSGLSVLFAPQLAALLGNPELAPLIRFLAITPVIGASNVVPIAMQSRSFDFKSMAIQTFAGTIAAASVSIPMAIHGFEVWALVAQSVVYSVVHSITIWIRTSWRPGLEFSSTDARSITSFSSKIFAGSLLGFIRSRTDQVVVGIAIGPAGLGIYALSRKLSETINALVRMPIGQIALPTFSRIQDNQEKLEKTYYQGTRLNAAISFPIFTGLAILAPESIAFLFGDRWSEAVLPCMIFSMQAMVGNLIYLNYHLFISQGHPGHQTLIQVVQAITFSASALIGSLWGIVGVATGGLLSSLLVAAISIASLRAKTGIHPILTLKSVLPATVSTAAMMVAAIGLKILVYRIGWSEPISIIGSVVPVSALVYIAVLHISSPELLPTLFTAFKGRRGKPRLSPAG